MKNRIIAAASALAVCALTLASCSPSEIFGKFGITSPPSTSAPAPSTSAPETTASPSAELYPPMDLENEDLSKYIKLDYKGLELTSTYERREITDEITEEELEGLMVYYGHYTLRTTGRAEAGDWAEISYTGYLDGEPFQGGSSDKATILLDDEKSGFIPGFASGIVGAEAGAETDVRVTFPADYHAASLAGKETVFKINVHGICVCELTDALADTLSEGKYTTAADYRTYFKEYLATQEQFLEFENVYSGIFDALDKKAEVIELPKQQFDHYYETSKAYYASMAEFYNMDYEARLVANGLDDTAIREQAEKNVKSDLILYSVAAGEGIKITEETYREYIQSIVDYYNRSGASYTVEEIESYFTNQYGSGYLKRQALTEKVADAVYRLARVTYRPAE